MPHYFFDLINGTGLTSDEEGAELPGLDSARLVALHTARQIMAEELTQKGEIDLSGKIVIRSDERRLEMEVGFAEAVNILPAGDDGSPSDD